MSRAIGLALAMALFLSACLPGVSLPGLTGNASPDAHATDSALAATLAVETMNALPTATLPITDVPIPTVTQTKTAVPTLTLSPMLTASATLSNSPATDTATVTLTGALATASLLPTETPASGTPAAPTATETLHPRFYGTLPPAIPYGKIVLLNKSRREVYVSLQCTTLDGSKTILEYPVGGKVRVSAPAGHYVYVAWVGGQKFNGWFNLSKNGEISITFEKDKVKVH
ncbi:MAG: hypothetical protein Fur0043_11950 [Anaerolineales bacterium]